MPQQSPIRLPTPPPTSSPHKPLCAGPPEQSPPPLIPMREYDDVLLAQEAAEDSRLQARASRMWRESQEYSCAEDNETTPWLQHTRWPERFRNRPLDIITASSRLPARGCYEQNGDFPLGSWRGIPLRSSAAVEARIRVLMRAIDDMFDRAEATLACTSYQSRCWLTSYRSGVSRNRPLRVMPSSTGRQYKSKWKRFICYIFRALELGPRRIQEMHSMLLRSDDIKIMDPIVNLASQIVERGNIDDEDCEEDTEDNAENDSDRDSDRNSDYDSDCERNYEGRIYDQSSSDFKDGTGQEEVRNNGEDTKDGYAPYHDASKYIFRLPHGTGPSGGSLPTLDDVLGVPIPRWSNGLICNSTFYSCYGYSSFYIGIPRRI
ncbi:hypothetical protein MGU_08842 [Metarhizium guizhouense ARSEF 977]|uniref:Telomere-associated recQ-like helicase n=1 Tax=Metarhizium guizhouense (strain ARSEF 977) TaxID=1276136 RepID=A0A0B4GAN3_METGA|nr:hypothetical protein MGU_08842 [Metarhizium guizhouense ARSEF 977]